MLGIQLQETRVYQEAKAEGREEGLEEGLEKGLEEGLEKGLEKGREEGQRSIVLRLLNLRAGKLPKSLKSRVEKLSKKKLARLSEALFDFGSIEDLEAWLDTN